jgi:hypothetical protein
MAAPARLYELVERFNADLAFYRSQQYNETQARQEFIDPLFELLGWDIDNKRGAAAEFREVVLEYSMKMGSTTKAPDYLFRLGNAPRFFVEAKKPAVNLKESYDPAFQVRRYAWTAKLPLSVLTDFEEFAIYDTRVEPNKNDKPTTARHLYLPYTDYGEQWEAISTLFHRDAVLAGSLERFAQEVKAPKGSLTVDRAFLAEIDGWREVLAANMYAWDKTLSTRELNYAVQMTLDRLIFLRIAEDRGIEVYGRLKELLSTGGVYRRLLFLFEQADNKYNSGLFHFNEERGRKEEHDTLTPRLHIDDEVLQKIIRGLYYPDSPYEFSVLPVEVLGNVYEQFLGKVITIGARNKLTVEEKPEVRKAGGVYYTPQYIVDYIVANTVGKLLEGKTPKQAEKLRVLDPACGSGSFLIGAYQYLLDWHTRQYVSAGPEKHKKQLYQAQSGEWQLTTPERKRILLNNIYGVDLDGQAVEVTKLSLSLKMLEGESARSLSFQQSFVQNRVLPDLSSNIKCGNSLIGPDFYATEAAAGMGDEELMRINPFDWHHEFAEIMRGGGFDAVIGNPPWISLTGKFKNDIHSDFEMLYLIEKHSGNTYMPNMYEYFVSKGLDLTSTNGGYFSLIVPDRLGFNSQFVNLRRKILEQTSISILGYKFPFPGIVADTLVFVLHKNKPSIEHEALIFKYGGSEIRRHQKSFLNNKGFVFDFFENVEEMSLVNSFGSRQNVVRLDEIYESTSGFGGKSKLIEEEQSSFSQIQTLKGDSIGRYETRKLYWFEFIKENITGRTTDKVKLGANPKILLRKTGDKIIATFDESGIFPEQSLYFLYGSKHPINGKYVLGLLNSLLLTFYFRIKSLTNKESIAQVKKVDLDALPIRTINFDDPTDVGQHDRMVQLVELMLELHKKLPLAQTSQEKTMLQRRIEATDKQIDALVYQLYELTAEEIAIVEG